MLKFNSSLPPQPWNYRFPALDMTVRFDNFGPPLSNIDVAYCLLDAANKVIAHWHQFGPMSPTALVTTSGNVKLHLVSADDIKWNECGTTIGAITSFVKTYEAIHMDFSILISGTHLIAVGNLSSASSNHT